MRCCQFSRVYLSYDLLFFWLIGLIRAFLFVNSKYRLKIFFTIFQLRLIENTAVLQDLPKFALGSFNNYSETITLFYL